MSPLGVSLLTAPLRPAQELLSPHSDLIQCQQAAKEGEGRCYFADPSLCTEPPDPAGRPLTALRFAAQQPSGTPLGNTSERSAGGAGVGRAGGLTSLPEPRRSEAQNAPRARAERTALRSALCDPTAPTPTRGAPLGFVCHGAERERLKSRRWGRRRV